MNDWREQLKQIKVNDNIISLAERAGCTIDKLGYGEGNLEEFATLIICECASKLELEYGSSSLTGDEAAQLLRMRFGVK
jgi:hypothetical protein